MQQTIGKRIMENRKRLGLTQDRLAELLGVSPQAVSKWENDQSCPDISMLPQLSDIFGITTDELLGRPAPEQVHTAQVIGEEADSSEPEGLHFKKGKWRFQWDGGRRSSLAFALWVLLCGGLLLAVNLLHWNVGFWDILWPSALLVFGISGLVGKFSFFPLGCTLFGAYFLADNLKLLPFAFGKEILLPVFLVLFGLSLLADALRKAKKPRFRVYRDDDCPYDSHGQGIEKHSFHMDENSFECTTSFGDTVRQINLSRLDSGEVSCSFGDLTVDLSGCQSVGTPCRIDADCSFGEITLLVPRRFAVKPDASTAFASVDIQGQPDAGADGRIDLDASVHFGGITVRYI